VEGKWTGSLIQEESLRRLMSANPGPHTLKIGSRSDAIQSLRILEPQPRMDSMPTILSQAEFTLSRESWSLSVLYYYSYKCAK
jgi:hypothetical protein